MKLTRLTLKNFRSQRDFVFEPNGSDASVFGRNRIGKSTLADAYFWLLFGTSSLGSTGLDIKPWGDNPGEPIHRLEHSVVGEFIDDSGELLTLSRTYLEVWKRKKGSAKDSFDSHTTRYEIDDVPVSESDFTRRVAELAGSRQTFELLSDPSYFHARLKPNERRAMLIKACGDVSDEDVIAGAPELAILPSILGKHGLDEYRAIVNSRMPKINIELELIPARIDEVTLAIPEDAPTQVIDVAPAQGRLNTLLERRAQGSGSREIAEQTTKLRTIEGDIINISNRLRAGTGDERQKALDIQQSLESEIRGCELASGQLVNRIASARRDLKSATDRRQVLIDSLACKEERRLAIESAGFEGSDKCPSCGQPLPREQQAAAIAAYNQAKAKKLEDLAAERAATVEEGKATRARMDTLDADIAGWEKEADSLEAKANGLRRTVASMVIPAATVIDPISDPEYAEKVAAKGAVEAAIESLRQDATAGSEELATEIASAQEHIAALQRENAKVEQVRASKARIDQLEAEQKGLAAEYEKLQGHKYLLELFSRTRVSMLSEIVNSKFRIVQWKLFEQQLNGGLAECCEATISGRPYSSSLSTSERINVGLDIINTFSESAQFAPPVWIDNCESITEPIETKGQQIWLIVSPQDDKKLRVALHRRVA